MLQHEKQSKTCIENIPRRQYWLPYIGLFIAWLTAHQIIRFFVRLQVVDARNVREAENLAFKSGVGIIFAMNHTNRLLDPFFVTAASTPYYASYPMFYVTGKMTMYQKYSSGISKLIYNDFIFKALGSQYIREGKRDYSKSLERHSKILRAGHSVCIFPEGQLSPDGILGKAHGGVGYLALETGAVVVPIMTTCAWDMSLKDFLLRKRRVVVQYGIPFRALDFTEQLSIEKNKYQQYAEKIMQKIATVSTYSNV